MSPVRADREWNPVDDPKAFDLRRFQSHRFRFFKNAAFSKAARLNYKNPPKKYKSVSVCHKKPNVLGKLFLGNYSKLVFKWKDFAIFKDEKLPLMKKLKLKKSLMYRKLGNNSQLSQCQFIVFVYNLLRDVKLLDFKAALTKNRLRKNENFSLMAPIGRHLIGVCTAWNGQWTTIPTRSYTPVVKLLVIKVLLMSECFIFAETSTVHYHNAAIIISIYLLTNKCCCPRWLALALKESRILNAVLKNTTLELFSEAGIR